MTNTLRAMAAALVTAPILLGGCGTKPKPPVFNLYAHARLAVVPFANTSKDPALGEDLRAALMAELNRLNAVPLTLAVPPEPGSASPWMDAGWREKVAGPGGCDLILVGSVGEYTETLTAEEPRRVKSKLSFGHRWGWADEGTVRLEAVVSLVDARTGSVLWTRATPGDGKQGRWTELGWPGDTSSPPPEGWDELRKRAAPPPAAPGPDGLLRGVEALVTGAREQAIAEVVRTVSADFLGRDGWEPPARPAPSPAPAESPAESPDAEPLPAE